MPFICIHEKPLTEKMAIRLQPGERAALNNEALSRNLSASALIRELYFNSKILSTTTQEKVKELVELGAHVKKEWDIAVEKNAFHASLSKALAELQRTAIINTLNIKKNRLHTDNSADAVDFKEEVNEKEEALSSIVTLRLLPDEKEKLKLEAEFAGITAGALVRKRIFGRKVNSNANRLMQRRARSLMAMLKHFLAYPESKKYPEIYSTLSVLATLLKRLGHDL